MAELKEAGVGRKEARGVGIVVDHRRRNLSEEGKKLNVERLLAYKQKLIVFPRTTGKPKKGDSSVSTWFNRTLDACPQINKFSRQKISPHLPLAFRFPCPNHTLPKHLVKLPLRSVNSKHTRLCVPPVLTPDTRVLVKLVLPR